MPADDTTTFQARRRFEDAERNLQEAVDRRRMWTLPDIFTTASDVHAEDSATSETLTAVGELANCARELTLWVARIARHVGMPDDVDEEEVTMPTDTKSNTLRYLAEGSLIIDTFDDGGTFAEAWPEADGTGAEEAARQIADALNYAERHPWVSPGPNVRDVGGFQILVRCQGEGTGGALWPAFWLDGEWRCLGSTLADSHWIPVEWQLMPLMPPAPERKG